MIIRYMNASKPYMLQNIHHEKMTPNLIDVLQLIRCNRIISWNNGISLRVYQSLPCHHLQSK